MELREELLGQKHFAGSIQLIVYKILLKSLGEFVDSFLIFKWRVCRFDCTYTWDYLFFVACLLRFPFLLKHPKSEMIVFQISQSWDLFSCISRFFLSNDFENKFYKDFLTSCRGITCHNRSFVGLVCFGGWVSCTTFILSNLQLCDDNCGIS